ncbi:MAG: SixA phosphatase family protein [Flavobacteriales bacterium]
MKTLYMLRHAKSSWKHNVIDHERPLNNRGESDAALLSGIVASSIEKPDLIISSDAKRALTTARYFKQAFNLSENDFITNHQLYDFSGQQVLETIKNLDNLFNRVMIVGHNHAFTSIVNILGNKIIDNLPTCGFVVIKFETNDWSKLPSGKTQQTFFSRDYK